MQNRVRQTNFEMLRIVGMLLIVMSHCDEFFGLADRYSTSLGIYKIITDWLHSGGQIGVGCFLLISGYFMVEQKVTIRKILKLVGEVWFYTIGTYLIFGGGYRLLHNGMGKLWFVKQTVYAFSPILFSHYWFVTAYIILLIVSPFLNKLIFALDKKNYQKFLVTLIGLFVILAGGIPSALSGMIGGRLIPVFVIYIIAGYIRRFGDLKKANATRHFMVALVMYFLLLFSFYAITYLGIKLNSEMILNHRYFYRELNSPLVVIICVELFIGFGCLEVKYMKMLNSIAGCTFGVYLIHQNRIVQELMPGLFPIYKVHSPFLVFAYSIFAVMIIYVVCTLIDWIRKKTVEKLWIRFWEKHIDGILLCLTKKWGKIMEKIKK